MPDLSPATRAAVEGYWASFLGLPASTWCHSGVRVVRHGPELADYRGVYSLLVPGLAILSAPASRLSQVERLAARASPESLRDSTFWSDALQVPLARVIGPAVLGYADAEHLRELPGDARLLDASDFPAAQALREVCPPQEWAHGGSDPAEVPAAGVFRGDTLAALAGYEVWGNVLAHLCVVTHPGYRGRGLGRQAVSRIALHALGLGFVPQYRTLESNRASMAIGKALGFRTWGRSIAVRLPP
ncbi:MAG: GNAT family N-acetyltransferase [Armatimonadota bacterium]